MRLTVAVLGSVLVVTGCGGATTTDARPTPRTSTPSTPTASPSGGTACTIDGTRGDDTLTGTPADDVVCGLGGDDHLRGGGGDDVILGGPGDDSLLAGAGTDRLDGGPGRDTADYSASLVGLNANLRNGTVAADGNDTLDAIEALVGSARADVIVGTAHDDSIEVGGGDDRVRLLGGNDLVQGREGDDVLIGDAGIDTCVQGPGTGRVACERTWIPVPFARVGPLTLVEPAQDPLLIAFHESLFGSAATLKPIGDKASWMIQPSRGRPTSPTSAVDVPLPAGTQVVSPVDGRVLDVIDYSLYCEAPDTLVVIRPADDRGATVEVLHLTKVRVRKGDDVIAGATLLGEPHRFVGGTNQVDSYVPGSPPHVHVEVEADGSRAVPDCDYPRGETGTRSRNT